MPILMVSLTDKDVLSLHLYKYGEITSSGGEQSLITLSLTW